MKAIFTGIAAVGPTFWKKGKRKRKEILKVNEGAA
jgi:hypothetical protein